MKNEKSLHEMNTKRKKHKTLETSGEAQNTANGVNTIGGRGVVEKEGYFGGYPLYLCVRVLELCTVDHACGRTIG